MERVSDGLIASILCEFVVNDGTLHCEEEEHHLAFSFRSLKTLFAFLLRLILEDQVESAYFLLFAVGNPSNRECLLRFIVLFYHTFLPLSVPVYIAPLRKSSHVVQPADHHLIELLSLVQLVLIVPREGFDL